MERGFDLLLTARAVFEQTSDVEPVEERLVVMRLAISQRCPSFAQDHSSLILAEKQELLVAALRNSWKANHCHSFWIVVLKSHFLELR